LGIIPIRIVKNLTHTLGNAAVGHSVGRGVRLAQMTKSPQPEQIQLRCTFLGNDRFTEKLKLEGLYSTKIPFPFVSGLTAIPLVTIQSLVFMQTSERKDLSGGAVVDFVITLQEFKTNFFIKLAAKLAWLSWITSVYPDPSSNKKLITTPPDTEQNSSEITTDYIITNAIDENNAEDLGQSTREWSDAEINAANILNRRFDKIPVDPNGVFPQAVKLQYVSNEKHYENFNNVGLLPDGYSGYEFPRYNPSHSKVISLVFVAKQGTDNTYVSMEVKIDNNVLFSQKILPEIIYTIGNYEITFNEIDIKSENINPQNKVGGDFGSKIEGGIRIK